MLRDINDTFGRAELSVDSNHAVIRLLEFVDEVISGFRLYYFSVPSISADENVVTFHMVNYFNSHLDEKTDGFIPYKFVKNPSQLNSRNETDLGVVISNKSTPAFPIIEFEAKRLSNTSNNSEYVYGKRGGIERFKRNQHGARLQTCGILGYIQDDDCASWTEKINSWVAYQANKKHNDLDWTKEDEKLIHTASFHGVDKWRSVHTRLDSPPLLIHHYFIDLVPKKSL